MSTYSPSLRIELITTGDQAGTWGNTTNTNLGTLIESSIAGYVSVSITSANQALTALNGAPDESRNMTIALTTTTAANFAVYAPPAEKTYVIYNASAYTATIYNSTVIGNTTAAGTGVAIPAGKTATVWTEGTNFRLQNTYLASPTIDTPTISSPTMTGTPVAPTAAPGTNTTQVATTAFVTAATTGLGTMATQNANSVAITGGSITGITDLAVADGGTGASTAANARTNLGTDDAANLTTGTVATARLATSGTASSSTFLRGDQTWAAVAGYTGPLGMQAFTSSGTFTVPTGVTSVKVTVVGGGGGVNVSSGNPSRSAAGGMAQRVVTGLTPGGTVSVTVGSVGANFTTPPFNIANRGATGGTSSFGAFCSATGGQGATSATVSIATGGAGSGGTLNINGQSSINISAQAGGFTPLGLGMPGYAAIGCCGSFNISGSGYGFGGYSAGGTNSNPVANGGGGVVIVEW
jgi:hypothetical protein